MLEKREPEQTGDTEGLQREAEIGIESRTEARSGTPEATASGTAIRSRTVPTVASATSASGIAAGSTPVEAAGNGTIGTVAGHGSVQAESSRTPSHAFRFRGIPMTRGAVRTLCSILVLDFTSVEEFREALRWLPGADHQAEDPARSPQQHHQIRRARAYMEAILQIRRESGWGNNHGTSAARLQDEGHGDSEAGDL